MRTHLVAGALAVAAAGCGGGGDGPGVATLGDGSRAPSASASPSASVDPEDAFLAFTRCMREQGIDMPDPGAGGRVELRLDPNGEPAEMEAARKKCEPLIRAGGEFDRADRQEMHDRALAYARCMREQGIDMPDPDFSGGGMIRIAPSGGPDMADPKFAAAEKACRKHLPDLVPGTAREVR